MVLVRADQHDRPLGGGDVRAKPVAIVKAGRDPELENADEEVDRAGHARAREDDRVLVGRADGVANDRSRLLPEAARLKPGPGRLRVGVRVERQDRVAEVVLDEGQRPARGRVIGVRDASNAERTGDRLVVPDHRRADQLDQVVAVGSGIRHRPMVEPAANGPGERRPLP